MTDVALNIRGARNSGPSLDRREVIEDKLIESLRKYSPADQIRIIASYIAIDQLETILNNINRA